MLDCEQAALRLANDLELNADEINAQGRGALPSDLHQYAEDCIAFDNGCGFSEDDYRILYLLAASLCVRGFDCPTCQDRVVQGFPDNTDGLLSWDDFQGASDNESSYVCDHCHMTSADAREIERELSVRINLKSL